MPRISFQGLRPASARTRAAARGSSIKTNTKCELLLRRTLWKMGFRYRLHRDSLPGRPDLVFSKQRLVVFCDGDFWHGRNLERRLSKLADGHNAAYWIAKVRRNAERDRQQTIELRRQGWRVLRLWETDIIADADREAGRVVAQLSPSSRIRKKSRKKT